MARLLYTDTDAAGGKPNTILQDRIQPMRDYFESLLPTPFDCSTCDDLQDVKDLYPELFTDDTHRDAVINLWIAGGHMLDVEDDAVTPPVGYDTKDGPP